MARCFFAPYNDIVQITNDLSHHMTQPIPNLRSSVGHPFPDGPLSPGFRLNDRYEILGMIALGGMGAVYQGRDVVFNNAMRLVAIKELITITQEADQWGFTLQNLEHEASILATLSHPAVPHIYDYFTFEDRAYLVMEYVQGRDLEEMLNNYEGQMMVDAVVGWGIQVCDVLRYLHNLEPDPIVFRDIKPGNLMIDHLGYVRLIDFGIARTVKEGEDASIIGTEGYSPPEQYTGRALPTSDIYALGATMHHLLSGRDPRLEEPFSFDDAPIHELNAQVSEALSDVIMKAVEYLPKDRHASAEDMKQALIEATS